MDTTLQSLVPGFLQYLEVEASFSVESLGKYRECLRKVILIVGNKPVSDLNKEDVVAIKRYMIRKEHSNARQVSILLSLRRFLRYVVEELRLPAMTPESVKVPRRQRREVAYLTEEEIERFLSVIPIATTKKGIHTRGLRFRVIVEVLLGTAMRISEALSLNREDIDFTQTEARIVGKGQKPRTVFFTDRALFWVKQYLKTRTDDHPALFISENGITRLNRADIWRPFVRYRKLAGISKRLTPHLLRHTAATQLLFKGCPIAHIKEVLGHERLETTCRYYLGLDKRAAKKAMRHFLIYDSPRGQ